MRAEIATPELMRLPAREAPAPTGAQVETALIGIILWRRRKWIAGAAALAVAATLGYSLLATPQYTAVAQIPLDPRSKQGVRGVGKPRSIRPGGGINPGGSQGDRPQCGGVPAC